MGVSHHALQMEKGRPWWGHGGGGIGGQRGEEGGGRYLDKQRKAKAERRGKKGQRYV